MPTDKVETGVIVAWEQIPGEDCDIRAYIARPQSGNPGRAVLVLPEIIGIADWRREETRRMARDLNRPVVVMSTYSRIGGSPPGGAMSERPSLEELRAAFVAAPDEQVARDLAVTAAWIREQDYAVDERPSLLGFCSGGGQGIYATGTRPDLVARFVSVYGNVVIDPELTADGQAIERFTYAEGFACPVQLHFGLADPVIPVAQVDRLEAELTAYGKEFEIHRYPGADHVFADPTHPNYDAEATAEMWRHIYRFL